MTTEHAADRLLDVMDATQPGRDLADALRPFADAYATWLSDPIYIRTQLRLALHAYDKATGREES